MEFPSGRPQRAFPALLCWRCRTKVWKFPRKSAAHPYTAICVPRRRRDSTPRLAHLGQWHVPDKPWTHTTRRVHWREGPALKFQEGGRKAHCVCVCLRCLQNCVLTSFGVETPRYLPLGGGQLTRPFALRTSLNNVTAHCFGARSTGRFVCGHHALGRDTAESKPKNT